MWSEVADRREIGEVVAMVKLKWPHSTLGESPRETAPFPVGEIEAAVRRLSNSAREHAPTVGTVVLAVRRAQQGEPPSPDAAQRWLANQSGKRTKDREWVIPQGSSPEVTAIAVANLAERHGAHEAVLRWVADQGVEAIFLRLPDPEMWPLDQGESADRRDKARHYEQRVIPDWERDPTPGIALQRAQAAAALATPATSKQPGLRKPSFQRALEPAMSAQDAAAEIANARRDIARAGAEKRMVEHQRRAALDAERRAEGERTAAAERELAEHAARRTGGEPS